MDKMNFNVDKNTGKEIVTEELDETEDEDFELESSSDNSSMRQTSFP